jgi:serpin B
MKKWVSLLLSITLAVGMLAGCSNNGNQSSISQNHSIDENKISSEVIEGNTVLAFKLFKALNKEDKEKNIFISPLSISTALAMTYQGAGTTTKEAMAEALGYTGIEDGSVGDSYRNLIPYLNQLDDKVKLNISNSVWVNEGEEVKPDFLKANQDIFRASVNTLDFRQDQAVDEINQWISEATNKKIDKMIDSPIATDVIMYLINAIYFKGDWAQQFDRKNTFESKFQAGNGSTDKIMMMNRKGKVQYGQGDNYQVVRLPYGNGKAAMYCVLPTKDMAIDEFITTLDADRWQAIKESIAERDEVVLQLPRFKLEYGIKNLNQSLTTLGMGEAFTENADFSGIRNDVCISKVLHKAIIEVNEEGSEAAAATAVEMTVTGMPEPLAFIADRPFLFLIVDEETGTILFMGKYCQAGQG